MRRLFMIVRIPTALLVAALLALFTIAPASAHGRTDVGPYQLVIGFTGEPAFQSEPNGLDLRVSNTETGAAVAGLEQSLKAEIIYGDSRRELELRAKWNEEGAYTADVLPTKVGDYTFHIFGDIEGTQVDVSMTSSPDTFSAIAGKATVAFPVAEPSPAELQSQAAAAAQSAQLALIVGGIGALLGLVGTIIGVMGLRARGERAAVAPRRTA